MFSYKTPDFIKCIDIKKLRICLTALYILSLIPMLAIGFYDWPSVDDFSMALQPHQTFVASGSFPATIVSVFAKTIVIYNTWVGYFFSSFMTCLCPSIFGEKYYVLVVFVILGTLTFGVIYFFDTLFTVIWKLERDLVKCAEMLTLLVIVNSIPNGTVRAEAFYWWSGAVNYTFMLSLSFVWLGMLMRLCFEDRGKKDTVRLALFCVLSFLLGGGNYMTALVVAVLAFLAGFIIVMVKLGKFRLETTFPSQNRRLSLMFIPLVLNICGLIVSAIAPGNTIRSGGQVGSGASPIKVILRSYYTVFDTCLGQMLRWEVIVALVILGVLFWKMSGKMQQKLLHPFLFTAFAISITAACMVPPLFAVDNLGGGRIVATIWIQFVIVLVLTEFYLITYIRQNIRIKDNEGSGTSEKDKEVLSYTSSVLVLVCAITFVFESALFLHVDPHYYSATSAAFDICSGSAGRYLAEKKERLSVLLDENEQNPRFEPHSVRPELLYQSDIYEDATIWENTVVATYYGKESVAIKGKN